jgi:hypothetical protein
MNDQVSPFFFFFLLMFSFETFLIEHIKLSTQGKLAAATQVQSAQNLKPLFKNLRSRVNSFPAWYLHKLNCVLQSLPPDMLLRIAEIVHYMQKRQYQRANDAYLRLSIGNAPWPIGVTMVGFVNRTFFSPSCSLILETEFMNVQPAKRSLLTRSLMF